MVRDLLLGQTVDKVRHSLGVPMLIARPDRVNAPPRRRLKEAWPGPATANLEVPELSSIGVAQSSPSRELTLGPERPYNAIVEWRERSLAAHRD